MLRLGELLVEARQLPPARLEDALRAQVMWGGRLGTTLVDLGLIDLETLTLLLARQQRLPAAFDRHFATANATLQARLPPAIANAHSCVPLHELPDGKIVIASTDSLTPPALSAIAGALRVDERRIITAIAPELRIRYQLERIYKIERHARFLRSTSEATPFPRLSLGSFEDDLDDDAETIFNHDQNLGEGSVTVAFQSLGHDDDDDREDVPELEFAPSTAPQDVETEESARAKRRYVPTLATTEPAQSLARIPMRQIAITRAPEIAKSAGTTSLDEAIRAIKRGRDRELVAASTIDGLQRFVPDSIAGCLLVVRGSVATTWKGFSRGGQEMVEVSVPVTGAGVVARALQSGKAFIAGTEELRALDIKLMRGLHAASTALAVQPIAIAGENLLVLVLALRYPEADVTTAEALTGALAAAFARMLRDAAR